MAGEGDTFVLVILAIIFPPAAVAFVAGCGADLCLNFLLTILGYLPGCIHAFWLVLKRAEANETYGHNNWTYTGMGEYVPRDRAPPGVRTVSGPVPPPPPPPAPAPAPAPVPAPVPAPAPPPTDQYAADKQPQPSQAAVDIKSNGYPGPPLQEPDSQQDGNAPPASTDQKQA